MGGGVLTWKMQRVGTREGAAVGYFHGDVGKSFGGQLTHKLFYHLLAVWPCTTAFTSLNLVFPQRNGDRIASSRWVCHLLPVLC